MKKNKAQLRKLMELNNQKADEYLAKFACEIIADIKKSKDNDSILENLDLLKEFIYKVPNEMIEIMRYIIEKKPTSPVIHKSKFGEFDGKSHKDLILIGIELLDHIRYIVHDEVLELIRQLSQWEDSEVKNKALEVIKKFAKYDFNILTKSKIGYGAQREILNFIKQWSSNKQKQNFDFIITATKELLNSSIEGNTWKDEKTLVYHSGVVGPTDFLKRIRRETIELLFELYPTIKDSKKRLQIISTLEEATRRPSNVLYGDDVTQMILDDIDQLIENYRSIVFNDSQKMREEPAIVAEIEKGLYWLARNEKFKTQKVINLRKDILKDSFYSLFRLLVGDPVTYKEEEGWDTADKKRAEAIAEKVLEISEKNLRGWITKLNIIAEQKEITEEWHFQEFKRFLRKIAKEKSALADNILANAFKKNRSLKAFTANFLDGFRDSTEFDLWDKYVTEIIKRKEALLVSAICFSLNLAGEVDLKKEIRNRDIELLNDIVKKQNTFAFLRTNKDGHFLLHYALINTLTRNYVRSPKKIEGLIVEEMARHSQYISMYFQNLQMSTWKKWMDVSKWSEKGAEFLKQQMIELPSLDWHAQGLLLNLGKENFTIIIEVFLGRIKKDNESKKRRRCLLREDRYEAVPYHFNPDLREHIASHPCYKKVVCEWFTEATVDWSVYNWDIGQFLQRVGGPSLSEILMSLVEKGDKDSLMKVTRIMGPFWDGNFDLCIEIARRTENEKILGQLESVMYATGVVSGEYGISEAYERKAKDLEQYTRDKDPRARKFVEKMIKSFKEGAERERQRADEEIQLRKIEFEG